MKSRWIGRGVLLLASFLWVLAGAAGWAVEPREGGSYLDQKEFFKPELYISSSHAPLDEVLPELPNRAAWNAFLAERQSVGEPPVRAFVDPRSGAATSLVGAFPLIPGRGAGNRMTLADVASRLGRPVQAVDAGTVAEAALSFVRQHKGLLAIDEAQLGQVRAVPVSSELWQVSIPQTYHGIPVRHGRVAASINNGNVVLFGTETWGSVRGLSPVPKVDGAAALAAGFEYAGGRSSLDEIVRAPALEVVPVAPQEHQRGEGF
ncbi:endopeptidase, partial [bacterium]